MTLLKANAKEPSLWVPSKLQAKACDMKPSTTCTPDKLGFEVLHCGLQALKIIRQSPRFVDQADAACRVFEWQVRAANLCVDSLVLGWQRPNVAQVRLCPFCSLQVLFARHSDRTARGREECLHRTRTPPSMQM